jgi:serine/threonine protein phosphatase PrpC
MIVLTWGGATETGPFREQNEDRLLTEAPVFVVADGMGGHAGGEEASEIAVTEFAQLAGERVSREQILHAIGRANEAIVTAARADERHGGMGTTLAGLALVNDGSNELWFAFHVGDSRIYRLASGELEQLSKDHSEVQALIDNGEITEAQRKQHPRGHVVTRALGSDPAPQPDCLLLWPVVGERFLLCSDGVSGELTDGEIRELLLSSGQPDATAGQLIQAALRAGTRDNVTAVVIDVCAGAGDGSDTTPRSALEGAA